MKKPKIKLQLSKIDWLMEVVGALFLILIIGLPLFYFSILPETIPTHFSFSGVPDGFNQKGTIWTLPIICVAIYVGMTILNFFPQLFNYVKEITQENAKREYKLATELMRKVKLLVAFTFFYLEYSTIQVALTKADGLSTCIMLTLLVTITGTIVLYFYRVFKS